jgi:hypothetical protein
MNPKVLTKYYDQLTARERLALLLAASVRGDPVERQRLLDSAPRTAYLLPHHHALAEALSEAATLHLVTLLDVAANFWHWWGLWGWSELRSQRQMAADQARAEDAEEAEDKKAEVVRTMCMVRYQAYLFLTHREGWKQFCQASPVEPEALLQIKPGWDMVVRTEAQAREHAYSPEDAAMFLLSEMRLPDEDADEEFELPQVLTVADLAQVWHTAIDLQMKAQQGKDKC